MTDGTSTDPASRVDASKVDASKVDASRVDASRVDASRVDASSVDASRVDASSVDTGTVDTGTDAAIAEVEEQMSVLAGHIRTSMRDAAVSIDPALQPFGLKLLRVLARRGPTHASALAESLVVDKSVISRQTSLLQNLGLIEMQTDPDDGRARFFALTPTAVDKIAEVRANNKVRMQRRLGSWPTEELMQFAAFLGRLNTPDE